MSAKAEGKVDLRTIKKVALPNGRTLDLSKIHVEVVLDLYKRALHYKELREQWVSSQHYDSAAKYAAQMEAMVETIENWLVFSVGNGLEFWTGFDRKILNGVDARLESIGVLFDTIKKGKVKK
jgi:hypothetical protein